jgi:uncharacterized membrane protein
LPRNGVANFYFYVIIIKNIQGTVAHLFASREFKIHTLDLTLSALAPHQWHMGARFAGAVASLLLNPVCASVSTQPDQ